MDKKTHWVTFFTYIFNPNVWVCPYLTQSWVKAIQHFWSVTSPNLKRAFFRVECDNTHFKFGEVTL